MSALLEGWEVDFSRSTDSAQPTSAVTLHECVGHSADPPEQPNTQSLHDHAKNVAELAAGFAAPFGGAACARWLGWWHDAGKAHESVQVYLRGETDAKRGPNRSSVGMLHALGVVQLTFSRSLDPVVPQDVSITRVAVTKEEDAKYVTGDDGETSGKETEMGRKAMIPYGLYRGHGFVNPMLAADTGFDGDDLALFWRALQQGFELDRSASRGLMALRGLYVFSHDDRLGNAPAHTLFERVSVERTNGEVPHRFADYDVKAGEDDLPDGVTLTKVVG